MKTILTISFLLLTPPPQEYKVYNQQGQYKGRIETKDNKTTIYNQQNQKKAEIRQSKPKKQYKQPNLTQYINQPPPPPQKQPSMTVPFKWIDPLKQ